MSIPVKYLALSEAVGSCFSFLVSFALTVKLVKQYRKNKNTFYGHGAIGCLLIALTQLGLTIRWILHYGISDEYGKIDPAYFNAVFPIFYHFWWGYYIALLFYYQFILKRLEIFIDDSPRNQRFIKIAKYVSVPVVLPAPVFLSLNFEIGSDAWVTGRLVLVAANMYISVLTMFTNWYIVRRVLDVKRNLTRFRQVASSSQRSYVGRRMVILLLLAQIIYIIGMISTFFRANIMDPEVKEISVLMLLADPADNIAIALYAISEILYQRQLATVIDPSVHFTTSVPMPAERHDSPATDSKGPDNNSHIPMENRTMMPVDSTTILGVPEINS